MPSPGETLLDRFRNARASLLSSAKFQKFCAGFWPTRFIARRKAADVFDLCNGFVYSQILHACVRLDLLTALQERSRTIDEIADLTDLPRDGAGRLVRAAVALDILEPRSRDRFGLGEAGAAVLGSPGLQGMILHHEHFYEDLSDIVALLKGRSKSTALANYWLYSTQANGAPSDRTVMATYSELMRETQTQLADEILRAYPFKGHQHLMDVGGGDGAFLCEVHSRLPQLKLSLFDLPNVIDLARPRLEALSVPVTPHSGDMFADAWPNSADVISLIRVCLDHDDDKVRVLLKRARAALKPGGVLLIAEPMSDSPKVGHAYFGFYLWAMGSGRARASHELIAMLRDAGFSDIRTLPTGLPDLVRVIRVS